MCGFFEILGGVGLLWARTRKAAAWGLLALLVAVYPANIHMLVNEVYLPNMPEEKWMLWARMPFQFLFALAVLWTGEIWPKTTPNRITTVRQPADNCACSASQATHN